MPTRRENVVGFILMFVLASIVMALLTWGAVNANWVEVANFAAFFAIWAVATIILGAITHLQIAKGGLPPGSSLGVVAPILGAVLTMAAWYNWFPPAGAVFWGGWTMAYCVKVAFQTPVKPWPEDDQPAMTVEQPPFDWQDADI